MKEFFEVHRRLVIFAGVPFVFVLAVCTWLFWWPNPSAGPDGTTVSIPRGASFSVALDSLDAAGAISSRFTLKVAARIFGYDRMVRVGRYHFPPGMSNLAMLEDLASGSSRVLIAVPIPEGWRMEYIAKRFERFLSVDSAKIVSMCRDSGVIRGFGIDAPTLEGYLLPDTYEFYWQTDEDQIIRTMVNAFKAFYVDSLVRRQQELRLTLNETLALAAIVEGESSLDAERSTMTTRCAPPPRPGRAGRAMASASSATARQRRARSSQLVRRQRRLASLCAASSQRIAAHGRSFGFWRSSRWIRIGTATAARPQARSGWRKVTGSASPVQAHRRCRSSPAE